jgi:copper oxidase (laccase) domain-containing protein
LKLGIHAENILISSECTYCVPELFHSFRRDGSAQKGLRLRAVIVKPLR